MSTERERIVEVYKRRPGGMWRLVRDGREDLQKLWLTRQKAGKMYHGADFLIVPVGTVPSDDMEPTLSIPPSAD